VAEQLGEAVLKVSADTTALDAGLSRAREQAERAGTATEQAFTRTGKALQTAANGTLYFLDAQGRARDASGRFLTVAELQAAGLDKTGAAAKRAGDAVAQGATSQIRSIQSLQERLSQLRSSFESAQIGSRGFRELQREIQKTERELAKADQTLGSLFRQRAGGFGQNLLGALGLGLGVGAGAAVGGFLKNSIDQAVQLESVTRKLSNTLGPQGAGGALTFTKGLADSLGLNFRNLADSYSGFTAAATAANVPIEVQNKLFAAVSRSGQALGLSNDAINGSFLALQQVASKGTVAMEELRGQRGERLPIALAATARGLGISQQELIKLVESGKLTAERFFPALTKGLNELTAGAGGIPTAAQEFAKLGNAWEELQRTFGQNQLPAVTRAVRFLNEALQGRTQAFAAAEITKDFGIDRTKAEQLVGLLSVVQQKYNLTATEANKITGDAIKAIGAEQNLFRQRVLSAEQFVALQEKLPELAEKYRQANRDQKAEALKLAADEQRRQQELKKSVELKQKELTLDLQRNQAGLQYANLVDKFKAAAERPGLNQLQLVQLENQLKVGEKLRDIEAARLALKREQDKPAGTDGRDGRQSASALITLRDNLRRGEIELATLRVQNQQAEADAVRTQEDRLRATADERDAADQRLALTVRQTDLERQSLATGIEASRTAVQRLQLQDQLTTALRAEQAAQEALAAEQARPPEVRSTEKLTELANRVDAANANVRQAYADAGRSLVSNAKSAADALRGAQESIQSTLRGGFDLLTRSLQQEQIERARAAIQPLVNRGVIRTGLDISTPEQLFRVASFAESFTKANDALGQAMQENAAATQALVAKDWNVYVTVPGQPAVLPVPRT